jgi:hypothetical protein
MKILYIIYMASTRNKNTRSDYYLEQQQNSCIKTYNLYVNSQYGEAYKPALPTLGITPSHMPRNTLSYNPVDIESSLYGINSTNLVYNVEPVNPQLKTIPDVSYFDRLPMIMPKPLVVEKNQRPFPIPN